MATLSPHQSPQTWITLCSDDGGCLLLLLLFCFYSICLSSLSCKWFWDCGKPQIPTVAKTAHARAHSYRNDCSLTLLTLLVSLRCRCDCVNVSPDLAIRPHIPLELKLCSFICTYLHSALVYSLKH